MTIIDACTPIHTGISGFDPILSSALIPRSSFSVPQHRDCDVAILSTEVGRCIEQQMRWS